MTTKLEKYFSGEMDEAESLKVQLWIAEHPDDPDVLRLSEAAFDDGMDHGTDAECALRAVHGAMGLHPRKNVRSLKVWNIVAAAVALVAVPLAVTIGIMLGKGNPVEYRQFSVPDCSVEKLTLSDGTLLTLGPGSSVVYPDRFDGKDRSIFLDGQVFAEVSKDPKHPFIIHSGDVDVKVYGTKFNFKSWHDADQVELCLVEGAVTMDLAGSHEVVMKPGEMVRYNRSDCSYDLGSFDSGEYGADDMASLRFNDETLAQIACELERAFGVHIAITDDKLAAERFYSYFTNGETLPQILDALSAGTMDICWQGDKMITIKPHNKQHE